MLTPTRHSNAPVAKFSWLCIDFGYTKC